MDDAVLHDLVANAQAGDGDALDGVVRSGMPS